jgi:peroxiredoxin
MRDLEGLERIAPQVKAQGGVIVTVSMDQWTELAQRQARMAQGMTMLADPSGDMVRTFGLEDICFGEDIARPAAFLIDGEGIVRWRNLPTSWRYRPEAQAYLSAFEASVPHE